MTPGPGETLDSIVHPDLLLFQPRHGYRFALDPVLLSAFPEHPPSGPIADLGCGCGVISLLVARRWPRARVVALELQPALAHLARRNVVLNNCRERVDVICGDLRDCSSLLPAGAFGAVICNPPYRKAGTGRLPADPERAVARHELRMDLAGLVQAAAHLLAPDGHLFLTWKPDRHQELLERLAAGSLAMDCFRPVISRPGDRPYLNLCRARRRNGPARLPRRLPPLAVRRGDRYSPEMSHILKNGFSPAGSLRIMPPGQTSSGSADAAGIQH